MKTGAMLDLPAKAAAVRPHQAPAVGANKTAAAVVKYRLRAGSESHSWRLRGDWRRFSKSDLDFANQIVVVAPATTTIAMDAAFAGVTLAIR